MVLPSKPMPFHYDRDGQSVASASQFGLALSVGGNGPVSGWETPPPDKQLQFVQPSQKLPHLPKSFSFPDHGDLRWRPFVRQQLSPNDHHIPLLELQDAQGTYLGDAVTYIHLKESAPQGGHILYTWFSLLNSPQREPLLYDLFHFLAQIEP